MVQTPEDLRYELKFVSSAKQLPDFLGWLTKHPLSFFQPYKQRTVNNIYYDSLALEAARENLVGVSHRYKPRVRWYNRIDNPDGLCVEFKVKRGRVGSKQRRSLTCPDFHNLHMSDLGRFLRDNSSPFEAYCASDFRNPVIRNSYQRRYFESADGKIRVTVDSDLRHGNYYSNHQLITTPLKHSFPHHIIEVKSNQKNQALLADSLRGMPLRATRNSKYLLALADCIGLPYL